MRDWGEYNVQPQLLAVERMEVWGSEGVEVEEDVEVMVAVLEGSGEGV